MFFAKDKYNNKINIANANKIENYYCPLCNESLIIKKGNINIHHFSHKKGTNCDAWYKNKTEWHKRWQSIFPIDMQEVVIENDGEKHIADVLLDNAIIEFQYSPISVEEFNSRNEFYSKTGKKVIWVFYAYGSNLFVYRDCNRKLIEIPYYYKCDSILEDLHFQWNRRLKTLDNCNHNVDIYLNINEFDLVKINNTMSCYKKLFDGNIQSIDYFLTSLGYFTNTGEVFLSKNIFNGFNEHQRRELLVQEYYKICKSNGYHNELNNLKINENDFISLKISLHEFLKFSNADILNHFYEPSVTLERKPEKSLSKISDYFLYQIGFGTYAGFSNYFSNNKDHS